MGRVVTILAVCALLALAGCGGQSRVASAPLPAVAPKPPAAKPETLAHTAPKPEVMRLPGLDGVIGAKAALLVQEFGTPQIDLKEGDVRKLQFAGTPCVLDVYLYPPQGGGE